MPTKTVHLPSAGSMIRHALPNVVESAIVPAALFYAMLWVLGVWGALLVALGWAYLAVIRRVLSHRNVPAVLWLATAILTARTAISLATGSTLVYFLQPTATTFLVAFAFLASVVMGRPLALRLARDFCPLDPDLLARNCVRRFFLSVSLLWALVFLSNASITLWLLLEESVKTFVLEKTLIGWGGTLAAVAVSVLMFRRALRSDGLALRWGPATK